MFDSKNVKGVFVNCPNCGKEYDMDDYKKLKKVETISDSDNMYNSDSDSNHYNETDFDNKVYDARICSVCKTEFGFVRIVGKDGDNNIYEIDLDLIEPKLLNEKIEINRGDKI